MLLTFSGQQPVFAPTADSERRNPVGDVEIQLGVRDERDLERKTSGHQLRDHPTQVSSGEVMSTGRAKSGGGSPSEDDRPIRVQVC